MTGVSNIAGKPKKGENALLAVYSPSSSRFTIEDAGSDVRILALADFAFTVEIPYRLC